MSRNSNTKKGAVAKTIQAGGYTLEKVMLGDKVRLVGSITEWGSMRIHFQLSENRIWTTKLTLDALDALRLAKEVDKMRKLLKV